MKKRLILIITVLALFLLGLRQFWRSRITVQRKITIPMSDGVLLYGDHYAPAQSADAPTILIRSPYGRNWYAGVFGGLVEFCARRFAEQGYHVFTQDVRGRFDSKGLFEPYFNERQDGQTVIAWLKQQSWFNGKLGTWGPSYLGIVQWAVADSPEVQAMVPGVTASQLYDIVFPDGTLDLGLMMRWIALLRVQEKYAGWRILLSIGLLPEVEHVIRPALSHLPLVSADTMLPDSNNGYFQQWIDQAVHDPAWRSTLEPVGDYQLIHAPVYLIGGWYDFFLRGLLSDYAALKAAGKKPYLTIGPWYHFSHAFLMLKMVEPGVEWFDIHLKGKRGALRAKPVRLFVMGANQWREYEEYPPKAIARRLYLGREGRLDEKAGDAVPDQYCYDPADPTPIVGGTQFHLWGGARDNRKLERRRDVLTYTSPNLETPLEIIGPVRLELFVKSSLENTDFFGRLCDVYPDGRSINICDGLFRVTPESGEKQADGSLRLEIDMWATAYRFRKGHRMRLLVSSGAHPRWSRHTGSSSPLTDIEIRPAQQTIFHDCEHPSALVLPVPTEP